MESFLPQTPPTSSPYFQRPARRNLNLELSEDRRETSGRSSTGDPTTPQDRGSGARGILGPRRAAVIARKRLPLGDICDQTTGIADSELKDYLTKDEPSSREGLVEHVQYLLFSLGLAFVMKTISHLCVLIEM